MTQINYANIPGAIALLLLLSFVYDRYVVERIETRNAMTDFSEVAEMERLRNFNPQDGPMQVWQNRVQGDARMLDTLDEYLTEPRLP